MNFMKKIIKKVKEVKKKVLKKEIEVPPQPPQTNEFVAEGAEKFPEVCEICQGKGRVSDKESCEKCNGSGVIK